MSLWSAVNLLERGTPNLIVSSVYPQWQEEERAAVGVLMASSESNRAGLGCCFHSGPNVDRLAREAGITARPKTRKPPTMRGFQWLRPASIR